MVDTEQQLQLQQEFERRLQRAQVRPVQQAQAQELLRQQARAALAHQVPTAAFVMQHVQGAAAFNADQQACSVCAGRCGHAICWWYPVCDNSRNTVSISRQRACKNVLRHCVEQ